MLPQQIETTEKQGIENLLTNEPNNIPQSDFLFKIWQMEYIENGLREY